MKQSGLLYFALGVTTVISIGAVANQVVPLAPSGGMSLTNTSIGFPDGTEQTTAAANPGDQANNAELHGCSIYISAGSSSDMCSFGQVPIGKILVVEFVSGGLSFPSGQSGEVEFRQSNPGGTFTHHNLVHRYQYTDSFGNLKYNVSQVLRLYVPEENTLIVRVIRNTTTGNDVSGDFWMTGYYVDALP